MSAFTSTSTEAGSPIGAAKFRDAYLAAIASGHPVHRVTRHFFENPLLQSDVDRFIAGSPMTQPLYLEVRAYSMCLLDDTVPEAVHRDVSRISVDPFRRHCGLPTRCATLRREQNLCLYKQMKPLFPDIAWLQKATAVVQTSAQAAALLKCPRTRGRLKDVAAIVYRIGEHALQDTSQLADAQMRCSLPEGVPRNLLQDLQLEFLQRTLSPGMLLTIPVGLGAHNIHSLVARCPAVAGLSIEAASPSINVVKVIDPAVGKKHHVRTSFATALKGMTCPVTLQPLTVWSRNGSPVESLELAADNPPQTLDFCKLAPWATLRRAIRVWSTEVSDVAGCIHAYNGRPLWDDESAMVVDELPAIVLMEQLRAEGWTVGQPSEPYQLGQPLVYRPTATNKAYLRCLLQSRDILSAGLCVGLPHDQPNKYYLQLLGDTASEASLQPGKKPAVRPVPDPSWPDDVPGCLDLSVEPRHCARRPKAKAAPVVVDNALDELLGPPLRVSMPPALPADDMSGPSGVDVGIAEGDLPVDVASAGGATTSAGVATNPADAGSLSHLAIAAAAQLGFVREQHGTLGDAGAYLRYRAACRCRARDTVGQLPCRKQRNVGSTTGSNFGPIDQSLVWARGSMLRPVFQHGVRACATRPAAVTLRITCGSNVCCELQNIVWSAIRPSHVRALRWCICCTRASLVHLLLQCMLNTHRWCMALQSHVCSHRWCSCVARAPCAPLACTRARLLLWHEVHCRVACIQRCQNARVRARAACCVADVCTGAVPLGRSVAGEAVHDLLRRGTLRVHLLPPGTRLSHCMHGPLPFCTELLRPLLPCPGKQHPRSPRCTSRAALSAPPSPLQLGGA